MFRTVIVPLDGSKLAESAIGPATSLARRARGELLLAMVTTNASVIDHASYLNELAETIDVPCEAEVAVEGHPSAAIMKLAEDRADSIVCMSSHARGVVGQALLGGVTASVIRGRPCPVVVVGPRCLPAPAVYDELVVPVDGSPLSEAILPLAVAWAGGLDICLQLVHVVDPEAMNLADEGARPGDVYEGGYITRIASELASRGIDASWEVLHDERPAHAIARFAADRPAAMVAMTTHGRTGIPLMALGSIATHVVHDGSCPVLLLRPEELDGTDRHRASS